MSTRIPTGDDIAAEITRAMRVVINRAVTEEIEEAKKRLTDRIPELATQVSLTVQHALNMMDNESIIQIRVKPRV